MKTKKILTVSVAVLTVSLSFLTGCQDTNNNNNVPKNVEKNVSTNDTIKKENNDKYKKVSADKVPLKMEDIKINFVEMTEPDSIGTTWMIHNITNKSIHTIAQVKQVIKVDDKSNYILVEDKLKPGKTSLPIKSFAPMSKNIDDVKPVSLEIAIINDNSKSDDKNNLSYTYILYDYELNEYQIKENVKYLNKL